MRALLTAVVALAASCCFSADEPFDAKKLTLQDLAFMSGKWKATAENSVLELSWTAQSGNNMLGMFRLIKKDVAALYELKLLEQTADGPALRVIHFGADGKQMEFEPLKFALIEFAKDRAVFEVPDKKTKLIYQRTAAEELTFTLDRADKEGKRSQTIYKYKTMK